MNDDLENLSSEEWLELLDEALHPLPLAILQRDVVDANSRVGELEEELRHISGEMDDAGISISGLDKKITRAINASDEVEDGIEALQEEKFQSAMSIYAQIFPRAYPDFDEWKEALGGTLKARHIETVLRIFKWQQWEEMRKQIEIAQSFKRNDHIKTAIDYVDRVWGAIKSKRTQGVLPKQEVIPALEAWAGYALFRIKNEFSKSALQPQVEFWQPQVEFWRVCISSYQLEPNEHQDFLNFLGDEIGFSSLLTDEVAKDMFSTQYQLKNAIEIEKLWDRIKLFTGDLPRRFKDGLIAWEEHVLSEEKNPQKLFELEKLNLKMRAEYFGHQACEVVANTRKNTL